MSQKGQGQGCVRDLLKAKHLVDEIKPLQQFGLTSRVLDLEGCVIVGVSDASLGGADMFGFSDGS